MNAVGTSRPFQERFLGGYRRPLQLSSLSKKCATMALGLSLALTGVAIPLDRKASPTANRRPVRHLAAGRHTAEEVVGRVQAAVSDQIRADFFLKHVPLGSIIYSEARKHNVSPELVASVAFNETRDYVARVHRFQRDLLAQMTGQDWTTPEERRVRRAS